MPFISKYLLAIDQGTSGTTALLMDTQLNLLATHSVELQPSFPKPSWVEHDLSIIWKSVLEAIQAVTQSIHPQNIIAIGLTNQRETICFWDRNTQKPLAPAIVWQDRRTTRFCQALLESQLENDLHKKTGLFIDPYFSGSKIQWALENWPQVQKAHYQGSLALGTMDSYLLSQLSQGTIYATEPSNACRTLCFHLTEHQFDDELCQLFQISASLWPEVKPSMGFFGKTKGLGILPDGIPITGVLGDQQASLLGQDCLTLGSAKCTCGTGAFLLLNTGNQPILSQHRLLTTIAWSLSSENYTYALEGSAFIAGAAIQWLKDAFGWKTSFAELEALACSVDSTEGVMFVPALSGLGAPYWDPQARGLFTGMTLRSTQAHIARAVFEGIAFQNADLIHTLQKDLGRSLNNLHFDGGVAANNLFMQIQSNILGQPLQRSQQLESTSLGALLAAGVGVGLWKHPQEIASQVWKEDRTFLPQWEIKEYKSQHQQWQQAIQKARLHV